MWWRALALAFLFLVAGCFERPRPDAGDDGAPGLGDTQAGGSTGDPAPSDDGVQATPQPLPDPAQPGIDAANLTRRMLTGEQIRLVPPATEWVALRMYLSDSVLTGGTTHIAFVSTPAEGAEAYLALAVYVPSVNPDYPSPPPAIIPLAMPAGDFTTIATIRTNEPGEGNAPPPDSPIGTPELMVLYGTTAGQATLHFGIVAEEDAADPDVAGAEILGRPVTNIAPDHGGPHGFAGSFIRTTATDGTRFDIQAGNLVAAWDAELEGPLGTVVDRHLSVHGEGELPVDGVVSVVYAEVQALAHGEWSYDWVLGNKSGSDSGSGPMTTLPVPGTLAAFLGTRPPTTLYQGPASAGPARLDIERTFSGKEDLSGVPSEAVDATNGVLVSWGYIGADLARMYGWASGSFGTSVVTS